MKERTRTRRRQEKVKVWSLDLSYSLHDLHRITFRYIFTFKTIVCDHFLPKVMALHFVSQTPDLSSIALP